MDKAKIKELFDRAGCDVSPAMVDEAAVIADCYQEMGSIPREHYDTAKELSLLLNDATGRNRSPEEWLDRGLMQM